MSLVTIAAVVFSACGGDITAPSVARIEVFIAPERVVGERMLAHATLRDRSDAPITMGSDTLVWRSSSPAVASVSSAGAVTALSPGFTVISATLFGVTGSATLAVTDGAPQPPVVQTVNVAMQLPSVPVGQSSAATVTLRDASGAVLTGRIVGYGSSSSAIATISPAGVATGLAPGTVTITATSEGKSGTAALTVTDASTAPGPAEPRYQAGQVLLFQDEFDYATFADANANGWRGTDGANVSDTRFTTDPLGANQIIAGGYDGTGHAMRLKYFGVETDVGAKQEARSWSRLQPDATAAKPGHAFYVTYYFRITPGGGYVLDQDPQHIVQVKWIELWNTTASSRLEFDTSYSHCYNDVPKAGAGGSGTLWHIYGNSAGNTTCQAGQVRGPFAYQGQGGWHRATHKYVTKSSPTARDGVAQMWVDGTLILSVNAADCGQPVPNAQSLYNGAAPTWCTTADLDAMMSQETVSKVTLGSVMTGALWPFTIDYDHMKMWRDP